MNPEGERPDFPHIKISLGVLLPILVCLVGGTAVLVLVGADLDAAIAGMTALVVVAYKITNWLLARRAQPAVDQQANDQPPNSNDAPDQGVDSWLGLLEPPVIEDPRGL